MASKDKDQHTRQPAKKDPGPSEKRAKDIGPPKEKSAKVKGGRAYSGSDARLKRAIRPL